MPVLGVLFVLLVGGVTGSAINTQYSPAVDNYTNKLVHQYEVEVKPTEIPSNPNIKH